MGIDRYWPFRNKPKPKPLPLPLLGLGTHSLLDWALDDMAGLGVTRIRHPLNIHLWTNDTAYRDWTAHRLEVACARGFKVLVVVHGEKTPFTPEAMLELLAFLPRRFPAVEAWQVLNEEPLHADGRDGAIWHDRAHWTIKGANSAALVIPKAMDPNGTWDRAFLGFGGPLDALAIHVYGWPTADFMRRMVTAARSKGKPVWVTEFGTAKSIIPHTVHDRWEEIQRDELSSATEAARGAARAYIYAYQTDEAAQYSLHGETHGIVRPDRSLRPAALWLRDHLAVHP